MMKNDIHNAQRSSESGFTLVEALVAIVILVFGLIAVTNLLIVAGASNSVAQQSTTATTHASEVMERLKSVPFNVLTTRVGGTLDVSEVPTCDDYADDCVNTASTFSARQPVDGTASVHTYWQIEDDTNPQVLKIRVISEGQGILARARSRADFTTIRTCTSTELGCPCVGVCPTPTPTPTATATP